MALLISFILIFSAQQFITNFDVPEAGPTNNVNLSNMQIHQNPEITNFYQPGLYLVQNYDVTDDMEVINKLKTIDYSIVKLTVPIETSTLMYPNGRLTFDNFIVNENEPSPNSISPDARPELEGIEIGDLWDAGYTGKDIVIAIVDTGIDFTHPALQNKMIDEKSFHKVEYGFSSDKDPTDEFGHGTWVASVAAGYEENTYLSPAYDAKLVNARLGIEGGGTTTLSVVAAFDWAISHPQVDIVTMSLSEPEESFAIDPLEEMMNKGVQNGKIMLSSAGNDGKTGEHSHQIGSPSSAPEAISVGSSNQGLAYFSSEGPSMGNLMKPDLLAPGVSIVGANLDGDYDTNLQGTSFSTPLVAGGIAVILEAASNEGVTLTPGQIKSLLARGTTDLGNKVYQQGFGSVNFSKSYDLLINQNLDGIIGPNFNLTRDNAIQLPVMTSVNLPISLIGFNVDTFDISSTNNQISIDSETIYYGNTTIVLLELTALDFQSNTELELIIHLWEGDELDTISYYIPIEILEEPEFNVLLDLKHTIFDSVLFSPTNERLERISGDDIRGFVDLIRSKNGWVTELLYQNFTYNVLSHYDIIWMPTAFSKPLSPLYDHEYQDVDLTKEELFALTNFIKNGGSIIADFSGDSAYSFSYATPSVYLEMFSHLTGINITNDEIISNSVENPVGNYGMNSSLEVPAGTYQLQNGLPIVDGTFGYSGILKKTTYGGNIYLHNSREWRDSGSMENSNLNQFHNQILDKIISNEVEQILYTQDSIIIDFDDSFQIDDTSFTEIILNGIEVTNDFEIEKFTSNSSISISGLYNESDQIFIDLQINESYNIIIDEKIPENSTSLINYQFSALQGEDITSDNFYINFEFEHISFTPMTVLITANAKYYGFSFSISDNSVTAVPFDETRFDAPLDDYLFTVLVIDNYGRFIEFDLTFDNNSENSRSVTGQNKDSSTAYLVPITLTSILLLVVFLKRMRIKNHRG